MSLIKHRRGLLKDICTVSANPDARAERDGSRQYTSPAFDSQGLPVINLGSPRRSAA